VGTGAAFPELAAALERPAAAGFPVDGRWWPCLAGHTGVRTDRVERARGRVGSGVDGDPDHAVQLAVNTPRLPYVDPAGRPTWVDARVEQHLVGADVPRPGDKALVHEQRLHAAPVLAQEPSQGRLVDVQGVRAEVVPAAVVLGVVREGDVPEPSLVDEEHAGAAAQRPGHSRVLRRLVLAFGGQQHAGHLEVEHQVVAAGDPGEQVLAPSCGPGEPVPDHPGGQCLGGDVLEQRRVVDAGLGHRSPQGVARQPAAVPRRQGAPACHEGG
jgi:hypothetical protein